MLSIPHMIVVFIVVLVVFGPQKLPELAKGLGKLMAEFRKASTDFKSAFENEMRDLERQAAEVERKKRELIAKANAALEVPATLATPSGAETQPAPAQLADSSSSSSVPGERVTEADAGTEMTPIVTPVAESVARSSATEAPEAPAASTGPSANGDLSSNGDAPANPDSSASEPLSAADLDAITEKPQRTAADSVPPLDNPHDHKQPA
jgi:sec-independent protein translocase protein TatB